MGVLKVVKTAAVISALSLSSSVWALTINGTTNVGNVDSFVASADLGNSGDAAEIQFVADALFGGDTTGVSILFSDSSSSSDWTQVDNQTDTVGAFSLNQPVPYYLLKLGTGNSTANTHYLFDNNDSLNWAVVNFSALDLGNLNFNFGRVSHVDGFDPVVVPEPGVFALVGFGLVAFGVGNRRKLLNLKPAA